MAVKGSSSTAAVAAEEVKSALSRARTLTSEEEKVVRLRHGVAPDLRAPLPQAAEGKPELQDELLLLEMQLMKAFRAHKAKAPRAAPAPQGSTGARAKGKIVRALRKKK